MEYPPIKKTSFDTNNDYDQVIDVYKELHEHDLPSFLNRTSVPFPIYKQKHTLSKNSSGDEDIPQTIPNIYHESQRNTL